MPEHQADVGSRSRSALSLVCVCGLTFAACGAGSRGAAAGPWVNRTAGTPASNALGLSWAAVASDASGAHLAAVTEPNSTGGHGDIWTSADFGVTWTNRTANSQSADRRWYSIASDVTGAQLVAIAMTQAGTAREVWTSGDSGATWSKRASFAGTQIYPGQTVASDATGTRLVVAAGDVWISADSGATWTDQTVGTASESKLWGVASDASGERLIAFDPGPDDRNPSGVGDLWTSDDAGQTWTNRTQGTAASGQPWRAVAADAPGTNLVAVATSPVGIESGIHPPGFGDIWTSADSGATWTNRTAGTAASSQLWTAVASDAPGTNLIAASANDVWRSADQGATWINDTAGTVTSGQVFMLASDVAGTHVVGASEKDIWTRTAP